MRKKFFSAILFGLLAVGMTSTVTSCKDYDDDIAKVQNDLTTLDQAVTQKEAAIKSDINDLKALIAQANNDHATKAALQAAQETLQKAIDDLNDLKANKTDVADLVAKDAELSAAIVKAQGQADAAYNLATENKEEIGKVAADLAATNKTVGTLSTDLAKAKEDIGALEAALAAQKIELETAIANGDAETLDAAKKDAKEKVDALAKTVAEQDSLLDAKIKAEAEKVAGQIKDINGSIKDLQELHEQNASSIKVIQGELKTLLEVTIPEISEKLGELDVMQKALAKELSSIVFLPKLYVDGIETIEYPFLKDTALVLSPEIVLERQRATKGETYKKTIRKVYDYVPVATSAIAANEVVYGPAWPVDYQINPANSAVEWAHVKGWLVREAEVATRASVSALGAITSPEKYDNGANLFEAKNGVATVGLKIEKPKALLTNGPVAVHDPHIIDNLVIEKEVNGIKYYYDQYEKVVNESATGHYSYGTDNIAAIQIQAPEAEAPITSDFAMLSPEWIHPEAIVWVVNNDRGELGSVDEAESHNWQYKTPVPCPSAAKVGKVHLWDTPQEALLHTQGVGKNPNVEADDYGTPDILLPWDDTEGIDLKKMIGTHVLNNCPVVENHHYLACWPNGEEKKWGMHYEFEFVEYTIDGNATIDSRYATLNDGVIVACDVDEDGKRVPGKQNQSTVGREPLVRVKLMYNDKVLLDGYILVRITKSVPGKNIAEVEYPEFKMQFDLCNAEITDLTTWAQFDEIILTKLLKGMDKADFDAQYTPDVIDNITLDQKDGGKVYRLNVYKDTKGNLDTYTDYDGTVDAECIVSKHTPHTTPFGAVYYYENSVQTTNHTFQVNYTEDELEYLTHDQKNLPVTKTIYVRYKGNASAEYKYIYVKFNIVINRDADPQSGIKTKINNYWFGLSGDDNEWNSIVNNLDYPNDKTDHTPGSWVWSNRILTTFLAEGIGNHVGFTNAKFDKGEYLKPNTTYRKFYFAPINTKVTDICKPYHVKNHPLTWTITAKCDAKDEKWNAFVCSKDICCDKDHKTINTPKGYNHRTFDFDKNTDYNTGLSDYRPDYVEGCTDNLHKAAKYTTHKFAVKDTTFTTTGGEKLTRSIADDAKNSAILQNCAIDYNDGCFTNQFLYATSDNVHYYAICELDQATGELRLIRNKYVPETVLDYVVNAVGYEGNQHENISKEFRTWVGVVLNNGCDVAVDMFDAKLTDLNKSIFQASWQRPINIVTDEPTVVEDAEDNGEFIAVYDLLKFFDWRGPVDGNMEGKANKWLWGYYNIHRVAFWTNEKAVTTNMHQSNPDTFVPLSEVSDKVHLYAYKSYNAITKNGTPNDDLWFFDTFEANGNKDFNLSPYSYVHTSEYLYNWLELNKGMFGYIFYENNGENVTEFQVRVPVVVYYEWGHFDTYVTVTIKRSQGN